MSCSSSPKDLLFSVISHLLHLFFVTVFEEKQFTAKAEIRVEADLHDQAVLDVQYNLEGW